MAFRSLQRTSLVVLAVFLIATIAVIDWRVDLNIAFGFLYVFPLLLAGAVLQRWQIVLTAIVCTFLSDFFDPFPFTLDIALPQDILVFTALTGAGLFSHEVTQNRRREMAHLRRVEEEMAARCAAEEQLEFLFESSPAAILTLSTDATILRANAAVYRLLRVPNGELRGKSIRRYIPALGRVPFLGEPPQTFRTEMQCRGERQDGEVFLANVFFSTYKTAAGPRLAALVVDVSEGLREREEQNLEQLMAGSRILVGAVSHEVRNVCGAIAIIHENLVRSGRLKANKDFEALGSLVETLNRIASLELKQSAHEPQIGSIDLVETLEDFRIVLDPYCQESDIRVNWEIPPDLPPVWADRHRLLQVLLNLTKNSERALEGMDDKRIDISAKVENGMVSLRVTDSGPGISSAEKLFQPFQEGAESTGLGLYLSRAFVRSFRGDLRHDPASPGCSFVIDLVIAGPHEPGYAQTGRNGINTAFVDR
jgi:two-component system sensor kinase FixL